MPNEQNRIKPVKPKKQGDLWERESEDDSTPPNFYDLAPNETPFCNGSVGKKHELTPVTPVDRFDPKWRNGKGHECKKCGSQWCKHSAEDLE